MTAVITKKAEYAIQILTILDVYKRRNERVTTKHIAEELNILQNLVIQLISNLRKVGWVESNRGPTGGVKLVKDASEINLREVIELIDGPIIITRCLISDRPCGEQAECHLRGIWLNAQQKMVDELEEVTIKNLADEINNY